MFFFFCCFIEVKISSGFTFSPVLSAHFSPSLLPSCYIREDCTAVCCWCRCHEQLSHTRRQTTNPNSAEARKEEKNETQEEWKRRRREQKGKKGRDGGCGTERRREFLLRIGPRVLRSSMQVLIKRIQKRGASSLCVEMWERVTWGGGGLTSPPSLPTSCPAAFLPCFHLFAAELPGCTRAPRHQEESSGQCEEEDWVALKSSPHSPQIPSPRPPQPEPACPAAYDKWGLTLFLHLWGC